jgi:hypothetical protein
MIQSVERNTSPKRRIEYEAFLVNAIVKGHRGEPSTYTGDPIKMEVSRCDDCRYNILIRGSGKLNKGMVRKGLSREQLILRVKWMNEAYHPVVSGIFFAPVVLRSRRGRAA